MSSIMALPELLKGKPALTAWCGVPEPAVAGILARETMTPYARHAARQYHFDAVARAIPLIAAAGKPAIARIPVGEFQTASKLLDAALRASSPR
jgi:4-hydroxy-2-oxoheptanedioate aldolase